MQTQSKHMLTAEGRLPDNRTGPQGQRIWILPSAYSRSQDKGKWHLRASRTTRKSKKVKSLFSCNYGLDYSSKAEAESQQRVGVRHVERRRRLQPPAVGVEADLRPDGPHVDAGLRPGGLDAVVGRAASATPGGGRQQQG